MSWLKEMIEELEEQIDRARPPVNDDGTVGDGSHEHLADVFERCFDRMEVVAEKAIAALKKVEANQ